MLVFCQFSPTFFSYSYKTYGESSGTHPQISDTLLTWAASVGSGICNGTARVVFGWMMDNYSFKTLFAIVTVINLVCAAGQYWAAWVSEIYFVIVLLNYACIGATYAIFPTSVQIMFGLKQGP
jgi:hypothetical protein